MANSKIQDGMPEGGKKAVRAISRLLLFAAILLLVIASTTFIANSVRKLYEEKGKSEKTEQNAAQQTAPARDYDFYASARTKITIPLQEGKWYTVRIQDGMRWKYDFLSRTPDDQYAYVALVGLPVQLDRVSSSRDNISVPMYHGRYVAFCGKGTLLFEVEGYSLLP